MKTTHFENSITASTTARDELSGMIIRNIHQKYGRRWRVVEAGAGIVILPETDRFSDCTGHELVKALGLSKDWDKANTERIVKALSNKPDVEQTTKATPQETTTNIVLTDTQYNQSHFLTLTTDQYRLLEWLSQKEYLTDGMDYVTATAFEKI